MRIVIDLQGAQSESRFRGIGRYTLSLAKAIVRNRGEHEIILALNGLFHETIEPIRAVFDGLLPQENIRVWYVPDQVSQCEPANEYRYKIAELIRESFLTKLQPDVVLVTSLFEGYVDDAVSSIGVFTSQFPTAVILYDLIPLLKPEMYLTPNPIYRSYYLQKIQYLKHNADLLLTISESTAQEVCNALDYTKDRVVNISAACDAVFRPLEVAEEEQSRLFRTYNINRPFVLYSGGADDRKNLPRLIQAYARLSIELSQNHQLVLVGKIPEGNIEFLKKEAKKARLSLQELVFTGYVSDDELVKLYNLCKVFVFPSLHEGFGLPALEAMACGAVVIGSNVTSIPEVIGCNEALFDPMDVDAIASKMRKSLEDQKFRLRLQAYGLKQARRFSWDKSAKRTIEGLIALHCKKENPNNYLDRSLSDDKLSRTLAQHIDNPESSELVNIALCISHNQSMAIERQLMLDISELVHRDAATGVQRVVRSYLKALLQSPPHGFRIEPVYATLNDGYRYARIFTQQFLCLDADQATDDPVRWQRGDIFFGLDMQHHVQLAHKAFYRQLRMDGVTVKFLVHDLLPIQLPSLFKNMNDKEMHEKWLEMITKTDGAVCVSKATAEAYESWISEKNIQRSPNFQITIVHNGGNIDGSKPSRGLPPDALARLNEIRSRPSFLCVATLEPRKGQQQIVDAVQLLWDEGLDINLVLVGRPGWKIEKLMDSILKHPEYNKRLFWLQGISDEYLEKVYMSSTCLIAASINEGFGLPLIEAARNKIPIVARDIPVFREVAGECAFYFTGEKPCDLAGSLKTWLNLYQEGRHPKSVQMRWITWRESTQQLKKALVQDNYPYRQLLVDVSELVSHDARSGIQRVVRNILKEWLNHPPPVYRVEPVYATMNKEYRYARSFTQRFLSCPDDTMTDEVIEYAPGDVFLGLDLQPHLVPAKKSFYKALRKNGVHVKFLVYDMLCVHMPQYFLPGTAEGFRSWLEVVAESDGAVCISKTVADDLTNWLQKIGPSRKRPFTINWFHIGADMDKTAPTERMQADAETIFHEIHSRPSFLMVGTVEPRKGHEQVLNASEQLWRTGFDFNLIIVGKQGWMVENLINRIRSHVELNKRLYWLEGIDDAYLESVYDASTCLIFASHGEGFGLPLIEAARHNLPIIARDIPVFREVAGEHAYYFNGKSPDVLVGEIKKWLILYASGKHPKSGEMPWMTWRESAKRLGEMILPQR